MDTIRKKFCVKQIYANTRITKVNAKEENTEINKCSFLMALAVAYIFNMYDMSIPAFLISVNGIF